MTQRVQEAPCRLIRFSQMARARNRMDNGRNTQVSCPSQIRPAAVNETARKESPAGMIQHQGRAKATEERSVRNSVLAFSFIMG